MIRKTEPGERSTRGPIDLWIDFLLWVEMWSSRLGCWLMGLSRYGNQRDANEPEIVAALTKIGATVMRIDTPADLLVGYRGRTFLLEVKLPPGPRGGTSHSKLTPDQVTFERDWAGQYDVARTVHEAFDAIGATIRSNDCHDRDTD
jgi:hypothetical protein